MEQRDLPALGLAEPWEVEDSDECCEVCQEPLWGCRCDDDLMGGWFEDPDMGAR